jgi:hypothetical protein
MSQSTDLKTGLATESFGLNRVRKTGVSPDEGQHGEEAAVARTQSRLVSESEDCESTFGKWERA